MADTTLNDVLGLDFSEYTTTPYNIKNEPAEKKQVMSMSDVLRGTTIGKEWKTPSIDTLTTMRDRVPTVTEDAIWSVGTNTIRFIKNAIPAGAIAAMTAPVSTVAGLSAGAAGWAGGSALGASAVSSLGVAGWWGKALGGLASVAGGIAGGLGLAAGAGALVAGVSPTETATEEYDSPLSPAYQNRMLRELDDKHTNGEITDEEYQKTKDEYLGFIKESKRILEESAINKDEKNMVVDMLDGREYPEGSVVDSVIAWGAKSLKDDQDFYDYAVEQRQMNPQGFANVFGGIVGNLVPYYASAYLYRAALTTPKLKTVFQGNRFRENIVEIPTNLSREQVTEKVGALAKAYTTAQMTGEYTAENVLKYIERTGDVNLENYEPSSVEGAMAGAYGRIGAITEFELGGVEPLIIGSFKKVGLKLPTAKVIAKTGGQEAYEETVQNLTQFLAGKVDDTETRTWGEFLSDTLQAAGWAAFTGGTIGAMTHRINRANLVKGIVKYGNGAITEEQATQVADTMIEMVEETMDYRKNDRLEKLKSYISAIYEDVDMPEAERADTINTIASLEYALISQWNTINGTDIADDPLFKGEVNALGWFRTGIPATQKEAIDTYFADLAENEKKQKNLEDWLKKAQEANNQELVKELGQQLDEIESKLEVLRSDKYRLDLLGDLVAEDKRAIALELRKRKQQLKAKQKTKDQNVIKELDAAIADQKAGVGAVVTLEETGSEGQQPTVQQILGNKWSGVVLTDKNGETGYHAFSNKDDALEFVESAKKHGYTDENIQIVGFDEQPLFQPEQFDLADENARLDDIYPAYEGETIEVDGKERTVYNSNGDRIAKSAEALTNFWRWFGDSKVVDGAGRPLVVYHGSYEKFQEFSKDTFGNNTGNLGMFGKGFYFTDEHFIGADYANLNAPDEAERGNLYTVYLKIENPLIIDSTEDEEDYNEDFAGLIKAMRKAKLLDKDEGWADYNSKFWDDDRLPEFVSDYAHKHGFDGIFGYYKSNYFIDTGDTRAEFVTFEPTQIKSVDNRGTFSEKTGNIYWQNRVSGNAPATYRGAYIPALRFILKANRMDASSLSHELAHDWFEVYVSHAQSGNASKEFMRSWGVLEKALGIDLTKPGSLSKASEIFARAYEAWIMDKKDWAKNIAIADKDKEELDKLFKNYQNHLRDIYNTIANPYFQITWGKVGELKPELRDWFDRMTEIKSLEGMVERGEITQEQANQERINQAIDTVIENTDDPEAKRALENAKVLNDTQRYEAEGGNKNALQRRIATLAKAIDENNMLIKENYDTHRDMLEVAKAADNFVRTRLDDALAIINGQMAEQEGLFKEDIYTALERLALENGDLNLLDELKNSEIANRLAKELGQRVAGFRNWTAGDLDVVSTVKMLDNKFNKALKNKKAQNLLNEATKMFESAQKEQDKLADKQLESTLKELECV